MRYNLIQSNMTTSKKINFHIRGIIISLYIVILFAFIPFQGFGDTSPPPPPPGGHGSNGNQVPGGGAPIGSGVALLIALGLGYGTKKVYDYKKHKLAE